MRLAIELVDVLIFGCREGRVQWVGWQQGEFAVRQLNERTV